MPAQRTEVARGRPAQAKQAAKRQRRQADEIEAARATEERDNRWPMANAREAIREEQW